MPESMHYANQTATSAPTSGVNSVLVAAKQNYVQGRVNHVAMEEAEEASDMVIGMFFINDTSAVVLFDYGAFIHGHEQQYNKQMPYSIMQSTYSLQNDPWV
jgi:hypothetical protein